MLQSEIRARLRVEISKRHNANPYNGPLGSAGYNAVFSGCPLGTGLRGCPLGTGSTPEAATRDLLSRANRESGTLYTIADCILEVI